MNIQKLVLWFCLSFTCFNGFADTTPAQKESPDLIKENSIQVSERSISVSSKTPDQAIKKRLYGILEGTGTFEKIEVSVNDGVVTLEGETNQKDFVAWSGTVAKNMDGVVGVVNNISYVKPHILSGERIKAELFTLYEKGLELLPLIVVAILVFSLFFSLAAPAANLIMRPINYLAHSELIRMVTNRIITIFIMLIGFYFFLRIAGLTQFAVAVISGTGVMGLILGLAFKDIAENFISSLLISAQRPFKLGDVIEVQGHKGVVRKVTARGTTLVDFDGNHIQIPNAIIYKNIIQNFTANPMLRGHFIIGIGYDASIGLAQNLGMNIMLEHEAVLNDPEPQVLVESLGSSTINLIVYFWVDGDKYATNKVSSMLMRLTMRSFEQHGITMPDDAREIIFPQGVPVSMIGSAKTSLDMDSKSSPTGSSRGNKYVVEDEHQEDLGSDTDDIKQQADSSRDPEEGKNIL